MWDFNCALLVRNSKVWWRDSSASQWTNIQHSNYNFYLLDNICYHLHIRTCAHFDKLSQVRKDDNSIIISRGKRMFKTIWRRSKKTPQSPKGPFISCKGLMTIDKKFQLQFTVAKIIRGHSKTWFLINCPMTQKALCMLWVELMWSTIKKSRNYVICFFLVSILNNQWHSTHSQESQLTHLFICEKIKKLSVMHLSSFRGNFLTNLPCKKDQETTILEHMMHFSLPKSLWKSSECINTVVAWTTYISSKNSNFFGR